MFWNNKSFVPTRCPNMCFIRTASIENMCSSSSNNSKHNNCHGISISLRFQIVFCYVAAAPYCLPSFVPNQHSPYYTIIVVIERAQQYNDDTLITKAYLYTNWLNVIILFYLQILLGSLYAFIIGCKPYHSSSSYIVL